MLLNGIVAQGIGQALSRSRTRFFGTGFHQEQRGERARTDHGSARGDRDEFCRRGWLDGQTVDWRDRRWVCLGDRACGERYSRLELDVSTLDDESRCLSRDPGSCLFRLVALVPS